MDSCQRDSCRREPARLERLHRYTYELSPNEKRGLGVSARRHANAWVVTIWDGSDATFGTV
jgi:hypothetical protein